MAVSVPTLPGATSPARTSVYRTELSPLSFLRRSAFVQPDRGRDRARRALMTLPGRSRHMAVAAMARRRTRVTAALAVAAGLVAAVPAMASASQQAVMYIPAIPGESLDQTYAGWIEIQQGSFGVKHPLSTKASFTPLTITKPVDVATRSS
jgi:hypothetical protein